MPITLFRNKGPIVSDGYQIIRCGTPREALCNVSRAYWPEKLKSTSIDFKYDPVRELNNMFNKNGYWFLDYWDENWPKYTNEAIGVLLRATFEGDTAEAPKENIIPSKSNVPRPSRIVVTNAMDETVVKYFDSVNQASEWIRDAARRLGPKALQAIDKLDKLDDQLAIYGWVYNGEPDALHCIGTAMNYLMQEADLDDFETHLLDGIHAYLFEEDKDAVALRDLIVNGPLSND